MILDLREIIGVPGGVVSFDFEPDLSETVTESIVSIKQPPRAAGSVVNSAGVLTFSAIVDADCICVCARCLKEFELPVHQQISVYLTEGGENGENPEDYILQGDEIDVGEIIVTEFILEHDLQYTCRDDCAGLCEKCGADLNEGSCSCKTDVDSRLEVLKQLLDD